MRGVWPTSRQLGASRLAVLAVPEPSILSSPGWGSVSSRLWPWPLPGAVGAASTLRGSRGSWQGPWRNGKPFLFLGGSWLPPTTPP